MSYLRLYVLYNLLDGLWMNSGILGMLVLLFWTDFAAIDLLRLILNFVDCIEIIDIFDCSFCNVIFRFI